ncbi:MAG: alpha/beta hydrolase [Anaerolineae bacterium]|jgi:pimeloyl-ACP methyl ester carboxylesterase|nr:alpha/beta hydrolase [Anaerolineae bacterium]
MKIKLKYGLPVLVILLLSVTLLIAQNRATFPAEELADPDGQFIEVNGLSIYYLERGEVDDPAILLLHGFGGSTFTWRDNMDALAEAGYRVIAFDRPPYGLSDKSTEIDYTNATYVDLTAGVMDALAIESAVLIGHSAGGGVIGQFAAAYPERVDGLVFVAGAVAIEGENWMDEPESEQQGSEQSSPMGGLADLASGLDPDSPLARAAVRTLITPERFTDILQSAYYNPEIVTPEVAAGYQRPLQMIGWEGAFLKLFTAPRLPEPLSLETLAWEIPTLLIWGREDTWVPVRAGERLSEVIPDAQLMIYDQTGHMPMEEQIEQFNADVIAWLAQLP